jgi:hypothetical protein
MHAANANISAFATEERWQAWLDIESARALTQADLEMIPREAADAIHCDLGVVSGHSSDRFTRLGGTGGSEIVSHDHFRDRRVAPICC